MQVHLHVEFFFFFNKYTADLVSLGFKSRGSTNLWLKIAFSMRGWESERSGLAVGIVLCVSYEGLENSHMLVTVGVLDPLWAY